MKQTDNILVMGIDHRPNDPDPSWRTDSIIVLALDRAQHRVGVVNIPRDLYVDVPGLGKARINQADYYGEETKYPGGGPALIGRVLSDTLGIPTDHYVRVQMNGLERLVDTLGGVTVTLGCPLYERAPDSSSPNGLAELYLPAGKVRLDGAMAKKFATWRYVSTDFGRTRRQQQLIWALRQRALQLDIIPRLPSLWRALSDVFTTDLSLLDMVNLATFGASLQPRDVHGVVLNTKALDYMWTDEGAIVLVVKDKPELDRQLGALWGGQALATLGEPEKPGECPPPPTPVPTFTPTASATPTQGTPAATPQWTAGPPASATVLPVSTATVTVTPTIAVTGTTALTVTPTAAASPILAPAPTMTATLAPAATPTGTPVSTPAS